MTPASRASSTAPPPAGRRPRDVARIALFLVALVVPPVTMALHLDRGPQLAENRRLREQPLHDHLEREIDEIPSDPIQAIDDLWKPISKEQLELRDAGRPLTHRLVRLPHMSRRSGRALGPVTGLLVDG